MPELPEVETIVSGLAPYLNGHQLVQVELWEPHCIGEPSAAEFCRRLIGQRIVELARRGKHIIFRLASGESLLIHLAMTGQLILRPADHPPDPFLRASFNLDSGQQLRFADGRGFGVLRLVDEERLGTLLGRLGPEPLSAQFTVASLATALKDRAAKIKPLLLDQSFVAGLGNIYADEVLFCAKINPQRRARTLVPGEVQRLYYAIREVLSASIRNRGTTFDTYRDGFGRPGSHQAYLRVYQRAGAPCYDCGVPLRRLRLGGRGTYFCPRCQPEASTTASEPR